MRSRLLGSTMLIALASVLVLGVPLAVVGGQLVREDARGRLEREADAIDAVVERDLVAQRAPDRARIAALLEPGHRVEITLPDGRWLGIGARLGPNALAERSGADGRATRSSSGRRATVVALAPSEESGDRVRNVWLIVGALSAGAIALAAGLALASARRLARPLERLASVSERLGSGDFSARAGREGIPETDAVAAALDASAERIARLVGREREFSSNVSHQLRTPLTALQLHLEAIEGMGGEAADEARAGLEQSERLERTIAELLALARQDTAAAPAALDAATVVDEHLARWRPRFAAAGRRLEGRPAGPLIATATPAGLGQALDVLLENALRYGIQGAVVQAIAGEGEVSVSVSDDGPGVPAGEEERIFDRNVSLHGGTGIGLAVARALVERDGGRLRLARARPPRFEILLPSP